MPANTLHAELVCHFCVRFLVTADVQFSYSLIYLFQLAVNEAVHMYVYVLYMDPVMAACLNMKLLQSPDYYHLQTCLLPFHSLSSPFICD